MRTSINKQTLDYLLQHNLINTFDIGGPFTGNQKDFLDLDPNVQNYTNENLKNGQLFADINNNNLTSSNSANFKTKLAGTYDEVSNSQVGSSAKGIAGGDALQTMFGQWGHVFKDDYDSDGGPHYGKNALTGLKTGIETGLTTGNIWAGLGAAVGTMAMANNLDTMNHYGVDKQRKKYLDSEINSIHNTDWGSSQNLENSFNSNLGMKTLTNDELQKRTYTPFSEEGLKDFTLAGIPGMELFNNPWVKWGASALGTSRAKKAARDYNNKITSTMNKGYMQNQIGLNNYNNNLNNKTFANLNAMGGNINIAPNMKGTFTAAATRHNQSVQDFASKVLANKENYSPAMVKKANFARNAAKWHALGGNLNNDTSNIYAEGGQTNNAKPSSSSNIPKIIKKLSSLGYNDTEISGIITNIKAENNGKTDAHGNGAYGLVGWRGSRFEGLKKYAKAKGSDWKNLDTQIEYIDQELRSSELKAYKQLSKSKTAQEAAYNFAKYFERPEAGEAERRAGIYENIKNYPQEDIDTQMLAENEQSQEDDQYLDMSSLLQEEPQPQNNESSPFEELDSQLQSIRENTNQYNQPQYYNEIQNNEMQQNQYKPIDYLNYTNPYISQDDLLAYGGMINQFAPGGTLPSTKKHETYTYNPRLNNEDINRQKEFILAMQKTPNKNIIISDTAGNQHTMKAVGDGTYSLDGQIININDLLRSIGADTLTKEQQQAQKEGYSPNNYQNYTAGKEAEANMTNALNKAGSIPTNIALGLLPAGGLFNLGLKMYSGDEPDGWDYAGAILDNPIFAAIKTPRALKSIINARRMEKAIKKANNLYGDSADLLGVGNAEIRNTLQGIIPRKKLVRKNLGYKIDEFTKEQPILAKDMAHKIETSGKYNDYVYNLENFNPKNSSNSKNIQNSFNLPDVKYDYDRNVFTTNEGNPVLYNNLPSWAKEQYSYPGETFLNRSKENLNSFKNAFINDVNTTKTHLLKENPLNWNTQDKFIFQNLIDLPVRTYNNVRNDTYDNLQNFKVGGQLNFANGGDFNNGVTMFNTGGTHEQNPNGGIPQGVDQNGKPNLVEQGEVKYNDFIYSNRVTMNPNLAKQLKLPKRYYNKTYADIAKDIQKESAERPNDPVSKKTLDNNMQQLAQIQEYQKQLEQQQANAEQQQMTQQQSQQMDPNQMSPEEQQAYAQQMAEQGQQAFGGNIYNNDENVFDIGGPINPIAALQAKANNLYVAPSGPSGVGNHITKQVAQSVRNNQKYNTIVNQLKTKSKTSPTKSQIKQAIKVQNTIDSFTDPQEAKDFQQYANDRVNYTGKTYNVNDPTGEKAMWKRITSDPQWHDDRPEIEKFKDEPLKHLAYITGTTINEGMNGLADAGKTYIGGTPGELVDDFANPIHWGRNIYTSGKKFFKDSNIANAADFGLASLALLPMGKGVSKALVPIRREIPKILNPSETKNIFKNLPDYSEYVKNLWIKSKFASKQLNKDKELFQNAEEYYKKYYIDNIMKDTREPLLAGTPEASRWNWNKTHLLQKTPSHVRAHARVNLNGKNNKELYNILEGIENNRNDIKYFTGTNSQLKTLQKLGQNEVKSTIPNNRTLTFFTNEAGDASVATLDKTGNEINSTLYDALTDKANLFTRKERFKIAKEGNSRIDQFKNYPIPFTNPKQLIINAGHQINPWYNLGINELNVGEREALHKVTKKALIEAGVIGAGAGTWGGIQYFSNKADEKTTTPQTQTTQKKAKKATPSTYGSNTVIPQNQNPDVVENPKDSTTTQTPTTPKTETPVKQNTKNPQDKSSKKISIQKKINNIQNNNNNNSTISQNPNEWAYGGFLNTINNNSNEFSNPNIYAIGGDMANDTPQESNYQFNQAYNSRGNNGKYGYYIKVLNGEPIYNPSLFNYNQWNPFGYEVKNRFNDIYEWDYPTGKAGYKQAYIDYVNNKSLEYWQNLADKFNKVQMGGNSTKKWTAQDLKKAATDNDMGMIHKMIADQYMMDKTSKSIAPTWQPKPIPINLPTAIPPIAKADEPKKEISNIQKPKIYKEANLKYAPAFGGLVGLLTDKGLDYTFPNNIEKQVQNTPNMVPTTINDYLRYKPMDTSYNLNRLENQNNANRDFIRNQSNGNRATAMAQLANNDYNYNNSIGQVLTSIDDANLKQMQTIGDFNRGTNQYNATAANSSAQANLSANLDKLKYYSTAEGMKQQIKDLYENQKSANLGNIFSSLGQVGLEADYINKLNENPALAFGTRPTYDATFNNTGYNYFKNSKAEGGDLNTINISQIHDLFTKMFNN